MMLNKDCLIEGLQELASKSLQEKLWVYGNESQMSSFTEAICCIFDDAGVTRAFDSGYMQKNFSDKLCHKMKELDRLINFIPEDARPEEIIEHPKMQKIRHLSSELIELLEAENQ